VCEDLQSFRGGIPSPSQLHHRPVYGMEWAKQGAARPGKLLSGILRTRPSASSTVSSGSLFQGRFLNTTTPCILAVLGHKNFHACTEFAVV
jgi:hypothetical protein